MDWNSADAGGNPAPDQLVISYGERAQIEKLLGRDERLLRKLRSQEFEIAVVGLEKAGKSTLSNALIRVNVLPAESERCTYTKTEIRSGTEDRAEVEFYSPAGSIFKSARSVTVSKPTI